jgi:hypothetical protein
LSKSEFVWCNGNGGHLNEQTLNDILKDLVKKANISVTGTLRFHLLRKFLMSSLHDGGFDSWETKRALGKEIPTSDDTYLKGLSRKVTEKFPQAYSKKAIYESAKTLPDMTEDKLASLKAILQSTEITAKILNTLTEVRINTKS